MFSSAPQDLSLEGEPSVIVNMASMTFPNGSTIPNGAYRFLLRALRVTGNPELDEDYDSVVTDSFGFQKKR